MTVQDIASKLLYGQIVKVVQIDNFEHVYYDGMCNGIPEQYRVKEVGIIEAHATAYEMHYVIELWLAIYK